MGLMSDEILGGGTSDDDGDLRSTLKFKTKRLNGTTKSYLGKTKGRKMESDQRRDTIKSSLLSVLDQDDMSYDFSVCSEADAAESIPAIRLLHKRSNSLDSPSVSKKDPSQPKLRGKKSSVIAETTGIPGPPPPLKKKSPRISIIKNPVRSTSIVPIRGRATGERRNTLSTGSDHGDTDLSMSERSASMNPRRRQSIGLFGGSVRADGRGGDADVLPDTTNSNPHRHVKRSMSLNQARRRTNDSDAISTSVRREPETSLRKPKGKSVGLGSFFSEQAASGPSRRTHDDNDSDSDGDSIVSSQSWISWAASSALKPLEKLYDDMNGVGEKRPKSFSRGDNSDSESTDEEEYPNTEAETYSTKLSTTDKLAGLRFVASKQRRQSLYV